MSNLALEIDKGGVSRDHRAVQIAGFIVLMSGLVWCISFGLLSAFHRHGLSFGVPFQPGKPDADARREGQARSLQAAHNQLRIVKAGLPFAAAALVIGVVLIFL